jgi:branched-chain amino acid transport system ATP-binding protein
LAGDGAPLLEASDLAAGYGAKRVLHGVSLRVAPGEVVGCFGHNGAGKTTLLRTLFGLLPAGGGQVRLRGVDVTRERPSRRARAGVALVPQGRGVFSDLTVRENLAIGAWGEPDRAVVEERLADVLELFPILQERHWQRAGTLSGGQQQMLAIGIALMRRPALLLLDEPSLGLAPVMVDRVLESVTAINERYGTAVLLVEQNVLKALRVVRRAYVMRVGRITHDLTARELLESESLLHLF